MTTFNTEIYNICFFSLFHIKRNFKNHKPLKTLLKEQLCFYNRVAFF